MPASGMTRRLADAALWALVVLTLVFGLFTVSGVAFLFGLGPFNPCPENPAAEAARLESLLEELVPEDAAAPGVQGHCDSGDPPYVAVDLRPGRQVEEVVANLEGQGWVKRRHGDGESHWVHQGNAAQVWISEYPGRVSMSIQAH